MESGFVTRTGEEILIEEQIEMEFEEKQKTCLQKLFCCCGAEENKEGATFIIITNQRIAIIERIEASKGDDNSDASVHYTYIVPTQILDYGFSTVKGNLKVWGKLCCCKCANKLFNYSNNKFYFNVAGGEKYYLGADSREQLDKIAEAMYVLTSK